MKISLSHNSFQDMKYTGITEIVMSYKVFISNDSINWTVVDSKTLDECKCIVISMTMINSVKCIVEMAVIDDEKT